AYDSFHKNKGTLYRVWHHAKYSDGSIKTFPSTPAPLAPTAKAEIPEIELAIRMDWGASLLFEHKNKSLMESGIWGDPDLFKIFTFPILKGDPENPMPGPYDVAISESMAKKYFADENPIGKGFRVSEEIDAKVTAVFQDIPKSSSLQFDFVLPFETFEKARPWMQGKWGNSGNQTFIKLHENSSVEVVNKKMAALVTKNCDDCLIKPFLQLYQDFHLYSNFKEGQPDGGAIQYVQIFSSVAIFILIIACINFMNLATARSATRCREVGVRKVIGAQRKNLILQFIGESLVISTISMVIALAMVQLLLPFFNILTNKQISLNLSDINIILILVVVVLFTGIFAGSYPAFFLSSFKPASILKGNVHSVKGGSFVRKGLVVFQFSLAVILISVSILVYQQVQFIRSKDLGLNREHIVTMQLRGGVEKKVDAFKTEALRLPGIISVASTTDYPFEVLNTTSDPVWPGKKKDEILSFKVLMSDENLIPMLGITLLDRRNFLPNTKSDTVNCIVNEAAVRAMGLKDPVGSPFEMWFGKGQIIGVVKDFNNQNFRGAIEPLVFVYYPSNAWQLFIKVDGQNLDESIKNLETVYKKFDQVYPFEYSFLDQHYNQLYQSETTTGKLAVCFTVIAVFISCLGLFGLASFTAERRTKELGVRKVLGASVSDVVTLLCSDFTKLIFIALLLGTPLAYYISQAFLSQYVYHTEIKFWIFGITGMGILFLAISTVIFQSLKAALTNPVNALRSE
ncbi:MAG TPA: FtsX-like permease family protein, partial [Chryseolinea sp.]|nr:FtsX-like permease family protein [Chryseolinea sp.]